VAEEIDVSVDTLSALGNAADWSAVRADWTEGALYRVGAFRKWLISRQRAPGNGRTYAANRGLNSGSLDFLVAKNRKSLAAHSTHQSRGHLKPDHVVVRGQTKS
jgi:hypothetical protein